jgi:hypothetical protein
MNVTVAVPERTVRLVERVAPDITWDQVVTTALDHWLDSVLPRRTSRRADVAEGD